MAELLEFQCRKGYILVCFICTMDVLRRQWHVKGRHSVQTDIVLKFNIGNGRALLIIPRRMCAQLR